MAASFIYKHGSGRGQRNCGRDRVPVIVSVFCERNVDACGVWEGKLNVRAHLISFRAMEDHRPSSLKSVD